MMPGMDSMEHGMAMVLYGMVWYVLHGIEVMEQMLLSHTQSYTAHRFNKHAKQKACRVWLAISKTSISELENCENVGEVFTWFKKQAQLTDHKQSS